MSVLSPSCWAFYSRIKEDFYFSPSSSEMAEKKKQRYMDAKYSMIIGLLVEKEKKRKSAYRLLPCKDGHLHLPEIITKDMIVIFTINPPRYFENFLYWAIKIGEIPCCYRSNREDWERCEWKKDEIIGLAMDQVSNLFGHTRALLGRKLSKKLSLSKYFTVKIETFIPSFCVKFTKLQKLNKNKHQKRNWKVYLWKSTVKQDPVVKQ